MNNNTIYQPLGKYIRQVDVRNKDLRVNKLLGVSISKMFIPSIANTIGTDMSNYKIVRRGQFAYGPVTSRNGEKISIALALEDEAIISQAYTVFEIVEGIVPEYLMMWFRRPEFDRYARYHSHGSVREIFSWDDLCETLVPLPATIEEQQAIVDEYETIARRIRTNEQLITKLEETAQTIYRQMFVDNIDKENLPDGWRMGTMKELVEVKDGTHDSPKPTRDGYYLITSAHLDSWHINTQEAYKISSSDYNKINERSLVEYHDILYSMIGTVGSISFISSVVDYAVKNVAIFKTSQVIEYAEYILSFLKSNEMKDYIQSNLTGSTQSYITLNMLRNIPLLIPDRTYINLFYKRAQSIVNNIIAIDKENQILTKLQSLLLAKIGQ